MIHKHVHKVSRGSNPWHYLASWRVWAFAVAGLGLNYLLSYLIGLSDAPLFLDSIGTILVSALCGSIPGMLVGLSTNLLNTIADPVSLYYGVISVCIAFVAARFARKGAFRHIWGYVLAFLIFAFFGGFCGSILTYFLYGAGIGTGVSAPWAYVFLSNGMSEFSAQLTADVLVDLLDKAVTVAVCLLFLRFMPKKFLLSFPNGELFATEKPLAKHKKGFISLENKLTLVVFLGAVVIGGSFAWITTNAYREKSESNFSLECQNYSSVEATIVDGDLIDDWLAEKDNIENISSYKETEKRLNDIFVTNGDLAFMYVYRIIPDEGCQVIFDLDTPDVEGGNIGDIVAFDSSFSDYIPSLVAGKEIPSIISNDAFGWLLTVYTPIKDSSGATVAYAGVDIHMDELTSDIETFVTKILSIELSMLLLIVSIVHYAVDTRIVGPVKALQVQTSDYSRVGARDWPTSEEFKNKPTISSNDELASLSQAINKEETSSYESLIKMERNVVYALANMVESRDANTGDHIRRTSQYVGMIAKELKKEGEFKDEIDDDFINDLIVAAPLHDVGKIKIPDSILNKPGKLTPEEFDLMKQHVAEGGKIIAMSLVGITGDTYLHMAQDVALYHHERYDGTGYLKGLKGDAIPLSARIMAAADVFDALVSKRSYKEPYSLEKSLAIIESESGTHFDPRVANALLAIKDQLADSLKKR